MTTKARPESEKKEKPTSDVRDADADDLSSQVINYQSTGWKGAAVLMTKAQIGLGVLSLPLAMDTLGGFVALIAILVIGGTITYGNRTLGEFALRHPNTHNPGDIGMVIGGRWLSETFGICFWLLQALIGGSGMLATSIAFNAVTSHATCTVVFTAVGAIITILIGSMPEYRHIAWIGWAGLVSIIVAIFVLMIAVGVADRPPDAPSTGDFDKMLRAFNSPTPVAAFLALNDILFAYAASPTLLPILSEMSHPELYNRSMFSAQGLCTVFYVVTAVVVWSFCGQYISSPALGSAGVLLKKVCYGLAFPALLAGAILYLHTSSKYLMVRLTRGTRHYEQKTFAHWAYWFSCTVFCGVFGFVIASAVPFFGTLLALIGAVFGSMLCLIMPACAWFYDHRYEPRTPKWILEFCVNVYFLILAVFLFGSGLYAASESIKEQYNDGTVSKPFDCANNAGAI